MNVVIKPFKTPLGYYVYDRETNSILKVDEHDYAVFERIHQKKATEEDIKVLSRYQEKRYCRESNLKKIHHINSNTIEQHLKHGVKKITLQVTQNCNLRCGYCAYSGKYEQRGHSNKTMSIETMKKSVDFLMSRSVDVEEKINIGFYGGEPFLEFQKIKEIIKYVQEEYAGREVSYAVTTNGTVFTDEILDFINDFDLNLNISLDGPKEIHNIHRVFVNGEGSFDKIMINLNYIKDNYPKIFERTTFNTVIAPQNDYRCIHEFFHANDVISDSIIMTNVLNPNNAKEKILYDDKYFITFKFERLKILFEKIGLYEKETSKLVNHGFEMMKIMYSTLGKIARMPECWHPSGPCTPGVLRPFVDVEGNIFPCERVSELSENMKIGHIDTGFDIEKVNKLLNIGEITEEECKKCWCFIHCKMCGAFIDNLNELSREKKLEQCISERENTLRDMKTICLLKEYKYDFREVEQSE